VYRHNNEQEDRWITVEFVAFLLLTSMKMIVHNARNQQSRNEVTLFLGISLVVGGWEGTLRKCPLRIQVKQ
jgi:hypothetical protein